MEQLSAPANAAPVDAGGPRKIILDCDPGHDDAVAMLLAHGNPNIELLAVTTVVGNQTLEKVTRNALSVGTIAGITGVPFAAGCDRPLVRNIETAPDIHGDSGMDGPEQPESAIELDPRHAVDLIIELIMSHEPGTITLVPTAGLTNIAMAARKEPRIVERVKEVVLMGGGYHVDEDFNFVEVVRRVLDLGPLVPRHVWGRRVAGTREMWTSDSVISWLLVRAGIDLANIAPPAGGRAPGWYAGLAIAGSEQAGS